MNYKFSLDSSSKKWFYPKCQKKRFVRYKNNLTNQYINSIVGRCDREQSCGYHYSPKGYFEDTGFSQKKYLRSLKAPGPNIRTLPIKKSYIENKLLLKSLQHYQQNNLIIYLKIIFSKEVINQVSEQYKIGTSKKWNGSTIFWQQDNKDKVRSGKVILYNKNTGKRSKKITWVHSILKIPNYNLKQCLFGLHNANKFPNSVIGIVESEKTAIILTALSLTHNILTEYLWMATGSLHLLKEELLIPIKNRKIVLYPDLGQNKSGQGTGIPNKIVTIFLSPLVICLISFFRISIFLLDFAWYSIFSFLLKTPTPGCERGFLKERKILLSFS